MHESVTDLELVPLEFVTLGFGVPDALIDG